MKDQVLGQRIKGKIFIGTIWMFSYYLTDGRMDNANYIGAAFQKDENEKFIERDMQITYMMTSKALHLWPNCKPCT